MARPLSPWVISMASELSLNVSSTLPLSHANGPGCRAVIWVQGCSLGCAGCYNPDTHLHAPKHLVPVGELAAWASSIKGIEGLTFSGGEPFEQASAVAEVIRIARKSKPELSVFVFTGYTLEEISSSHDKGVKSLLGMVDMLSAGRYESRKRDSTLLWRGSANQNLLYLTDRYGQEMESKWILESPIEEVHLMDSEIVRTGFLGVGGPLSRIINSWARSDP